MASVATATITFPSEKTMTQNQVPRTSSDAWNPFLDNAHRPREKKSTSSTSLQSPIRSLSPFDGASFPSPRRRTPKEPVTRFRSSSKEARFRQEERVTYNVGVINAAIPPPQQQQQQDSHPTPPILLHDITVVQPLSVSSEIMLFGHCRVANLSFEKHVTVRYTMDAWETYTDIEATYHDSFPSEGFDRFSFKLAVDPEKEVQLALRYNVNHQEYWDNNNGENYRLLFEMESEMVNVPVEVRGDEDDEEDQAPEDEATSNGQSQQPTMWSQKKSALSNYTSVDPWSTSAYWRPRYPLGSVNANNFSKQMYKITFLSAAKDDDDDANADETMKNSETTSTDLQMVNVQDDKTISSP